MEKGYPVSPSLEGDPEPFAPDAEIDDSPKREIDAASDPHAKRFELEQQFAALQSPLRQAEAFAVHDMIHPRETRGRLLEWIAMANSMPATELGPPKFSYRP